MASGMARSHRGFAGTVEVLSAKWPPGRPVVAWTGSRGRRPPRRRPVVGRACGRVWPAVVRPARRRVRRRFRAGWMPPCRRRRRVATAGDLGGHDDRRCGLGRVRVAASSFGRPDPARGPPQPRRRAAPRTGPRALSTSALALTLLEPYRWRTHGPPPLSARRPRRRPAGRSSAALDRRRCTAKLAAPESPAAAFASTGLSAAPRPGRPLRPATAYVFAEGASWRSWRRSCNSSPPVRFPPLIRL